MLDLRQASESLPGYVADIVSELCSSVPQLEPGAMMLVGAACRDALHTALGHSFPAVATHDLDLGLALSSWDAFALLAAKFPRAGDTGIRYRICGQVVDLLPFGDVEDPEGVVDPPTRRESVSVWAFDEVFRASEPLDLSDGTQIRIPSVAGYAAAKFGAWLDRSEWGETKDATDLALVLHWYAESEVVEERLYETDAGSELLLMEDLDLALASARMLGVDVASTVGPKRAGELLQRWPGDAKLFARSLNLVGGPPWPSDLERRHELIDAMSRGLDLET